MCSTNPQEVEPNLSSELCRIGCEEFCRDTTGAAFDAAKPRVPISRWRRSRSPLSAPARTAQPQACAGDTSASSTPSLPALGRRDGLTRRDSLPQSPRMSAWQDLISKAQSSPRGELRRTSVKLESQGSVGAITTPAPPPDSKREHAGSPRRAYVPVNRDCMHMSSVLPFHSCYLVKETIGKGSWGSVFAGRCRVTGRECAIKKIPKLHVNELHRFRQEASLLRVHDHPNIVRLYETFEDYSNIFMVMELCRGGELYDALIKVGHFEEREVVRLVKQMVSAVALLHENNVVHRDLKPENFMFSSSGPESSLKLIDFGLARRFQPNTTFRTKAGTLYYVSPQVLAGSYNEKCDIWSIGVITYLLMTGYPPFNAATDAMVASKIARSKPAFEATLWANAPLAKAFVETLLSKDPSKRPSARDVLDCDWFRAAAPHTLQLLKRLPHLVSPRDESVPFESRQPHPKTMKQHGLAGGGKFGGAAAQSFRWHFNTGRSLDCCSLAPLGTHSPLCSNYSCLRAPHDLPKYSVGFSDPSEAHTSSRHDASRHNSIVSPTPSPPPIIATAPTSRSALRKWMTLFSRTLLQWEHFSKQPTLVRVSMMFLAQQVEDTGYLPHLREMFSLIDQNSDGILTTLEIFETFQSLARLEALEISSPPTPRGTTPSGSPVGAEAASAEDRDAILVPPTMSQLEELVEQMDLFGTRDVRYSEFLAAGLDMKFHISRETSLSIFRIFDRSDSGRVSRGQLCAAFGWDKEEPGSLLVNRQSPFITSAPSSVLFRQGAAIKTEDGSMYFDAAVIGAELDALYGKADEGNCRHMNFEDFHNMLVDAAASSPEIVASVDDVPELELAELLSAYFSENDENDARSEIMTF
eukprot:Polyplicarium_translucidae@DN2836_c0_g1_i1.p1